MGGKGAGKAGWGGGGGHAERRAGEGWGGGEGASSGKAGQRKKKGGHAGRRPGKRARPKRISQQNP